MKRRNGETRYFRATCTWLTHRHLHVHLVRSSMWAHPTATSFYFYKSFWSVLRSRWNTSAGFPWVFWNPAEPDLALHQSLPHLLRNLFRNPVERDLALHQSLSNLLQNLRNLRNLLQNLVEPDPAPAPVYTGAILGWRSHLAYAVGEKLKNKKIKKDALMMFCFLFGAVQTTVRFHTAHASSWPRVTSTV